MKTVLMMITVSVLFLGGCDTTGSNRELDGRRAVLNKHGLPNQKYLIGSGVEVRFKAPEDGHIYLVETNSDKNLIIKPLEKGVEYLYDIRDYATLDPEEKALLVSKGIDPDKMDLAVYFVPVRELVQKPKQNAFDENGLPKEEYYVGGGYDLNYRAPERGVVYVIEANSGKIIQSKSLSKNTSFDLPIDPADTTHQTRLKAMGIDPVNMKLRMYFVPEPQGE